ncbi:MAG: DUF4258 domain-containing protein [Reyranellaceae bacterium]
MTAQQFTAAVRELAAVSDNVAILRHAAQRMRERGIGLMQVLDVLRGGRVSEGPALDIHGNWKATMDRVIAGQKIAVVVAIENRLIVITVF